MKGAEMLIALCIAGLLAIAVGASLNNDTGGRLEEVTETAIELGHTCARAGYSVEECIDLLEGERGNDI